MKTYAFAKVMAMTILLITLLLPIHVLAESLPAYCDRFTSLPSTHQMYIYCTDLKADQYLTALKKGKEEASQNIQNLKEQMTSYSEKSRITKAVLYTLGTAGSYYDGQLKVPLGKVAFKNGSSGTFILNHVPNGDDIESFKQGHVRLGATTAVSFQFNF